MRGCLMTRTTLFRNNRSQAVRLPKDVAFPEGVKEVAILRDGVRRMIVKRGKTKRLFRHDFGHTCV